MLETETMRLAAVSSVEKKTQLNKGGTVRGFIIFGEEGGVREKAKVVANWRWAVVGGGRVGEAPRMAA